MKKKSTLFFVSLMSFGLLTGCGTAPVAPTEPALDHITIDTEPTKKEYLVNEELDLTGLKVRAYYEDESSKLVSDYTTSGFDSSVPNDNVVVTVDYKGKTSSFTVKVVGTYTISYTVNNTTDLSPISSESVLPTSAKNGQTVNIKVVLNSGYTYEYFWPIPGEGVPDSFYDQFEQYTLSETEFSFVMPKGPVTFNFGIQSGTITKHSFTFATVSHATFRYAGSTEEECVYQQPVSFTITVDEGYQLDGMPFVVGDSSIAISKNSNDVYSFEMPDKDVVVSANVVEKVEETYTCTLATIEHATIKKHVSTPSLTDLKENDQVKIVVTVESGYKLDGKPFLVENPSWPVNLSFGSDTLYVFAMPAMNVTFSCRVVADAPSTYKVSFDTVNHCSFAFSGTSVSEYASGATVKFYVSIDRGYQLDGTPFIVGDTSITMTAVSATVFSFVMPAKAVTVSAVVVSEEVQTYSVTLDSVEHVTMSKDSSVSDLSKVTEGTLVTIIVTPSEGYQLVGYPFIVDDSSITVRSSSSGITNGYEFYMPAKDVTFSVTVEEIGSYTVTFATIEHVKFALVNPTTNPCLPGEQFKFTVTLASGLSIASGPFIVEDSSILIKKDMFGAYFFEMPAKDVTVSLTTSGTAEILDHISVQNPKTSYQIYDQFVKPTVYAFFTTGGYQDVTSSAKFTGYDLNNASNQTVTVTYTKNGVTVTTSYDITVSARTPSYSIDTTKPYEFNIYGSTGNVLQVYRLVFNDDGTGYYEREYKTQTRVAPKVFFRYTITESVLRATRFNPNAVEEGQPGYEEAYSYDTDNNKYFTYEAFSNPYKLFCDWSYSYLSIDFNVYEGSIAARLLNATTTTVRVNADFTVFNLAA